MFWVVVGVVSVDDSSLSEDGVVWIIGARGVVSVVVVSSVVVVVVVVSLVGLVYEVRDSVDEVAAPTRPGKDLRYRSCMDATDAIKTATNVTAAIDVSIISVLRRLPDLIDDAFFRNVGFGRFMELLSEQSLDHAIAVDVDIEGSRVLA